MTFYTPPQFTVYRILFGVYLAVDFALVLPWAAELFSSEGMPVGRWQGFPSLFLVWSGPRFVITRPPTSDSTDGWSINGCDAGGGTPWDKVAKFR